MSRLFGTSEPVAYWLLLPVMRHEDKEARDENIQSDEEHHGATAVNQYQVPKRQYDLYEKVWLRYRRQTRYIYSAIECM